MAVAISLTVLDELVRDYAYGILEQVRQPLPVACDVRPESASFSVWFRRPRALGSDATR